MGKKYTTGDFVQKAKAKHNDKYDYSNTVYRGQREKVCIICPVHGEFFQTPENHLSTTGCSKCAHEEANKKRALTKEEFIKRAKSFHGDKYDYSLVDYKTAKTKVKIICPVHGIFEQTPDMHQRTGCQKCGWDEGRKKQTFTTGDFVKRAKMIHKYIYDYSKVNYVDIFTKVCIICPIHGEFWQTPHDHLCGNDCLYCRNTKISETQRSTKEDFIKKAQEIHGDLYDYSKVEYVNNNTKVCIICKKHGEFYQRPSNHLAGKGCKKCALELSSAYQSDDKKSFIKKAISVHGNRYCYDEVEYKCSWEKVKIVCPKHGAFYQTPSHHLQGDGCPICKESKGESRIWVYLNNKNITFTPQYRLHNENLFCSNKELLVDFWLDGKNTIIEYHGMQHYKPIKLFGGEQQLEKQKERDIALRSYCKEHIIKLIEIPYTKYKSIESILDNELG